METATRIVALSIGGVLGVNARYWLALAIDRLVGTRFPWATLAINVSGAFALGLLATAMVRLGPHHPVRLLTTVGFLGGYTTFSTFALESHRLWEGKRIGAALLYLSGSVAAGFVAVGLGIGLALAIFGTESRPDQRGAGVSIGAEAAEPG